MSSALKRSLALVTLCAAVLALAVAVRAVGQAGAPATSVTAGPATGAPRMPATGAAQGDAAADTPIVVRVPSGPRPTAEAETLPFPCAEGFWVCDEPAPAAPGTPGP